jgi:hypothetical protein
MVIPHWIIVLDIVAVVISTISFGFWLWSISEEEKDKINNKDGRRKENVN